MAPSTKPVSLLLPVGAARPADISRLHRELGSIDEHLLQLQLKKNHADSKLPDTSHMMDQLTEINRLNLLKADDRRRLLRFLTAVRDKAPVVHLSLSADPDIDFIERLMTWLRQEIHPQLLVSFGLQPRIGAGCMLRTTNKQFDFSLKQDFAGKRDLLLSKLAALSSEAVQ